MGGWETESQNLHRSQLDDNISDRASTNDMLMTEGKHKYFPGDEEDILDPAFLGKKVWGEEGKIKYLCMCCRYILPSLSMVPTDREEWMLVAYAQAIGHLASSAHRFLLTMHPSHTMPGSEVLSPRPHISAPQWVITVLLLDYTPQADSLQKSFENIQSGQVRSASSESMNAEWAYWLAKELFGHRNAKLAQANQMILLAILLLAWKTLRKVCFLVSLIHYTLASGPSSDSWANLSTM